jgi:hypothetical protein
MTTHQRANIHIVNDTGERIRAVSIVHKYSDNYSNDHVWDSLEPGATSDALQVDYNTGFLTTGRDWWFVAWVSDDGRTLYYTNPQNLRGFVDVLESAASSVATLVGSLATSESGGWGGPVGALIVKPFVNSQKTEGFKQHILRSEDSVTKIHLTKGEVAWVSPSGTSRTGVASSTIPLEQKVA